MKSNFVILILDKPKIMITQKPIINLLPFQLPFIEVGINWLSISIEWALRVEFLMSYPVKF